VNRFQSWLKFLVTLLAIPREKAPDQNRTDTSSLEGYGSTIELQAHEKSDVFLTNGEFFFQGNVF
jgi:hypothetical protein